MKGYRCCVSWYHHQDFLEEFPDYRHPVADQLFLVDRDRITCSGGSGAADLAAFIVGRHLGPAIAQKSLHIFQLDRARPGRNTQPHAPLDHDVTDERVRRALLLMEQNIAAPLPIASLASRLGLSSRQMERLFRDALGASPRGVYRRLRLRHAQWLLENTGRSVTEVAVETGFSGCAHFSRSYKAAFMHSPSAESRQPQTPTARDPGPAAASARVFA